MRREVTVVDYGMGNTGSVLRALAACGASAALTGDAQAVSTAARLILPGVGAFGDGMAELRRRGLDQAIRAFARTGRPFLGICLGMQMMFTSGEEFGSWAGIGLMPGVVSALPPLGANGRPHRIPHVGWNRIRPAERGQWHDTILDGIDAASAVYFVHSWAAVPESAAHLLADCDYDGCLFAAVVRSGALYGCQFHPEKSGPVGLHILRNFLTLS